MSTPSLCSAVRTIVRRKRVVDGDSIELHEPSETNRCKPVVVRSRCATWALRLEANDHLRFLEELPKQQSVTKLPDYLLFAEPPAPGHGEEIRIVIGEIKSSETGAESALRQVQLGKVVAEYLVRLARLYTGQSEPSPKDASRMPVANFAAVIVSPDLPTNLVPKGTTRPGKSLPFPWTYDDLCRMHIFRVPGGCELYLEQLF